MKLGSITTSLIAISAALLLSGCLVRQTVTDGGEVVSDNYVVKRPLKDAVERSE